MRVYGVPLKDSVVHFFGPGPSACSHRYRGMMFSLEYQIGDGIPCDRFILIRSLRIEWRSRGQRLAEIHMKTAEHSILAIEGSVGRPNYEDSGTLHSRDRGVRLWPNCMKTLESSIHKYAESIKLHGNIRCNSVTSLVNIPF